MKVRELIEELQKLPQEADVYVMEHGDLWDFAELANKPYYGKEIHDERYVNSEPVPNYIEGVIIRS